MIPIARPVIGEEEIQAVIEVLRSGQLAQGRMVRAFEQLFAESVGVKHAVAVSSGTAALHLALLAEGVGPGDEVITTPFTFVATANAILYAGARPVFADICQDTFNLDPERIVEKITSRTKAILVTHLYGHPADMPSVLEIARSRKLKVVEDAAQAVGAGIAGQAVGTFGTGCFSLYATKNITTGEGGLITTNEDTLAERLRMLRSHGQRERYWHETLGYNYRLTDVQAAIGVAQMGRLEELTRKRILNAEYLNSRLRCGGLPTSRPGCRHVYHQYTIRVPRNRDQVARQLEARGVGTGIHYPVPIHRQPLYRELGYDDTLPVAEAASAEVLSLPVHPSLDASELQTIVRHVNELLANGIAPD